MLAPASSDSISALAPLHLLVCVDAATCPVRLGVLVEALERGGVTPSIWHLDKVPQAPAAATPVLTLMAAAAHATSELRVVQIVYHLRQQYAAPVLVLPSLLNDASRIAPWRNPFDGALPDVQDSQFTTQLHLWLRLQDAETRVRTLETRLATQAHAHEQLFAHLPLGVLVAHNPGGAIQYQNAAAAQICGMAMPSIGGYEHYDQFAAIDANDAPLPAAAYPLVRSLASGEVITDETLRWRRGDGRIVALRVHSAPVRDATGVITGALCLFRDITQQNAIVSLRRSTARRFEQITNAALAHIIVVDAVARYSFANRAHAQWCQTPEAQLIGQPLHVQFGRSHYPLIQCALDEALKGTASVIEHVLVDAACVHRHFLMRFAPLMHEDTSCCDIVGAIGYFVDIDELRQTEMQVARREMRFTFMSECLPMKVFTTDTEGALNYLNASWCDYIGPLWHASMGHGWTTFVHGDDQARLVQAQNTSKRAQGPIEFEYRLRRHDGVYRWHRARCLPLPAVGGEPHKREWVGVVIDVQEEVAARMAAEQAQMHTEVRSQLALAAVGAAREEVDALHQERLAREQFVATLSHDLRTPLTAARMGIERLQAALSEEPKLTRIAARVARSISRTDVMLEDFLDVSRVCAGKPLPLTRTPQHLRDIVAATLEDLDPMQASRCTLAESDPGVGLWDASSVRRVVENLIGNALKYGERQKPITVAVKQTPDGVELSVHNFGEPIAPDDQNRLFTHFDRLENATAGGQRGWGIGLTLVAGIARAYGGQVLVDSTQACGTTFRVRFAEASTASPSPRAVPPQAVLGPQHKASKRPD